MRNELPIGTVIKFKKLPTAGGEEGRATICGYDIFHTKYEVIKHSSIDDAPMPSVKLWLFESEIVSYEVSGMFV